MSRVKTRKNGDRAPQLEATERKAVVAIVVVRRVDIGRIEVEVERVVSIIGATRPIVGVAAGVVQGTIVLNIPATYKEHACGEFKRRLYAPIMP